MTINFPGMRHCCVCSGICYHVNPPRYCDEHKPRSIIGSPHPVVTPLPSRALRPCPATVEAVLGFDDPTTIPCGLEAGHLGKHRYLIEWSDGSAALRDGGKP